MNAILFLLCNLSLVLLYFTNERATKHLPFSIPPITKQPFVKWAALVLFLLVGIVLIANMGAVEGIVSFIWWSFLAASICIFFLPVKKGWIVAAVIVLLVLSFYL